MSGEAVTISVCHDLAASSTLWARHTLWDEVAAQDHGNNRPAFSKDSYFDFDVNEMYKMETQRRTIAELVGSEELAAQYIGDQSSQLFLSRGHLAPNADFLFYSWMDSTFHFINVAPQWQSFNGRNWGTFEANCREFAVERELDLVVYTGTSGQLELPDTAGRPVPIHLYPAQARLPVPRYYWKILLDPLAGAGVAVIGINNPHLVKIRIGYKLKHNLFLQWIVLLFRLRLLPSWWSAPPCPTTRCWPWLTPPMSRRASCSPAGWRTPPPRCQSCLSCRPSSCSSKYQAEL